MKKIIFLVFIAIIIFSGVYFSTNTTQNKTKDKTQKIIHQKYLEALKLAKKKKIEYFKKHRIEIISELNADLHKGKFKEAVLLSSKYLSASIQDKELLNLNRIAKKNLKQLVLLSEEQKLQAKILKKGMWVSSLEEGDPNFKTYHQLIQIYQKLTKMFPNNKQYIFKLKYYQKLEKHAVKLNKLFSPNGIYVPAYLEHLIKSNMNNPDSFKLVHMYWKDTGKFIVVKITFRGTNSFGGMVTQTIIYDINYKGDVIKRVL